MDVLLQDLRYAARGLRKSPGFTAIAVLTLALGIGTNSAIFSVIDAVLLRPLHYPDPDRLYAFVTTFPEGSFTRTSAAKFNSWRTYATAFEHISAYRFTAASVTTRDEPEQTPIGQVTADFFPLFGASTIEGRTFSAEEDRPNSARVVVLSFGYWQRRFGADRTLIGGTLTINGLPHTVVGVLSSAFQMPEVVPAPDLWLPLAIDPSSTEQAHVIWTAGRLREGSSLAEGKAQLLLAAQDFRRRDAADLLGPQGSFGVERYQDMMVRDVRPSLLILSGAVGFVLLIACANVANLLLVRAVGRKREMAVRSAIGAGRLRLVRQLLTESVLLSMIGGAVGLVLGIEGIRVLLLLNPAPLPRIDPHAGGLAVDWRVMIFTFAAALVTGIGFGLFPAAQLARSDLNATLKESGGRSGSFRQNAARGVLVVAQMALALVLLVGAALLIRTFTALRTIDPGFASDRVLTMRMTLTGPRFSTTAGVAQFVRDAEERLNRLPGVVAAATTCCVPLERKYGHLNFDIVGRASTEAGFGGWVTASPGYFDVFKIPLVRGRAFTDRDTSGSQPVVIISESLARRFWPIGDPLAAQLLVGRGMGAPFVESPRQIIGIVGDVREDLGDEAEPIVYVPTAQITDGMTRLINQRQPVAWAVRTAGDPLALAAAVQEQLRQASGGVKASTIRSMEDLRRSSTAEANFNMILLSIFGAAALLLAAIGIYGLMAYSVQQRTQEMGVRLALGAGSMQLRNMVVWQGMRVALIGVAIGAVAAFGLSRLLTRFLFGVTAHDPITFAGVATVLSAVALIGVWLPARRAARVDPVVALRAE